MRQRNLRMEIEVALYRMEQRGHQGTVGYERLRAKRDAIICGCPYQIIDVTEVAIASVASMIATTNRNTRGQLLPAKGLQRKRHE